ncbi:MAG TPA: dihydroneopterin aldolase [Candidatus Methylomirabilis sp.]|nr:dihydroneopterin aldolase [Candidatus Methylomirabilis sp.]
MTLPAGWLVIEGIRFQCIIGVGERERESPQEIVAGLHVKVDVEKVAASDSIGDTVDYRALTQRVIAAGTSSRFRLVEALAAHLVRIILDEFPGVQEVRVEMEKPGALRGAARSVRAVVAAHRGS